MASVLLGEDGRGYELARRLEGCGAWRAWLGDAAYASFAHALVSPAAWDSFMTSRSHSQIPLQLRARALLFDKASAALDLPPSASASASATGPSPSLSNVNPAFLQLHGDDIYFSLEDVQDRDYHQTQSRPALSPCKANEYSFERAACVGLRNNESENVNTSQRHRHDEFPDTWSNKCVEKYKLRHYKYPYSDKETNKRTPEGMSAYLKLCQVHKKRRQVFDGEHVLENNFCMPSRIVSDANNSTEEDNLFLPEIMFPLSCVPDSALPPTNGLVENHKVEFSEVLDNLPAIMSTSPAMLERFGIRPEYVKTGTKYRGKDGSGGNQRSLSQEQATCITNKVVARMLANLGFVAATETSTEVLSELISSHICKLGRILKLLTDSYRKQFSSIEVLKMFLQTTGHSNLGALAEITKNTNRGFTHQTQQHVRALQSQNQNPLLQAQQFQRQMHPQMNMFHTQNPTFQQQQLLWQRQATTRGSQIVMDKDQPMVEVKIENIAESPTDSTFSNLSKHTMQMRHLPMAMTNQHIQSGQQFKQLPHGQIPRLQMQNTYSMRMPVKVEAFHDLVGGDSSLKHEAEHNKLSSTPK